MSKYLPKGPASKIMIFLIASTLFAAILILRLFDLQIIQHSFFQDQATKEQSGIVDIPAQRGEIIIKDYHSHEEFLLATNTTLNLVYADPTMIKDPAFIAGQLEPLIYNQASERAKDEAGIADLAKHLPTDTTEEQKAALLKPLTDEELKIQFKTNLTKTLSERQRQEILLAQDVTPDNLTGLTNLRITGIEIKDKNVYAYPPQISNTKSIADKIAQYVQIPAAKLTKLLKGENRYVILKRKLAPEISEKISKMLKADGKQLLSGINMKEEYFRYYPEGTLAANLIGYTDNNNMGQYGIESSFNTELAGKAGKLQTKMDSKGRQITVGDSILENADDGDDVVLTIDRSIQLEVEKLLEQGVKDFQADSGQIIIMDPKTGKVIAMANYPTFNPNKYGTALKTVEIKLTPEEIAKLYPTKDPGVYYFYTNPITLDKYMVFEKKDDEGNIHFYRYENFVGPEVYHNKVVSWPYEPGSVFKPVAMSAALDDGDVTPRTTYNDAGPVGVDRNKYTGKYDFEIKNSTGYHGLVDMTAVISKSLNTGMTFVAKKMGAALMYSYLQKFGFLDRTDIEFDGEAIGKIDYFDKWTESELATHAFGQGLTVTMIQLANAYCAIINGGILMRPYIAEEVRHPDGRVSKTDPHEIRRIISEDTAAKMKAMLVTSAETGEAKLGQVPGHFVGGKTGTAQTYKHGIALTGKGTTIASYAGYGPVNDPKFLIVIKYDRPRTNEWGSATAAITFSKIATFLFDYYNIPPDK